MELRHALSPLLDRLGDYTIDTSRTTWKRPFALRGPTALPLVIGS